MLYCSIEDAWGPLPVNEQVKKYKGEGLEHFQNIIKKKVNRKLSKKKKPTKKFLRKKPLRERFEDTEESCDDSEGHYLDFEEENQYQEDEEQYQEYEQEQYQEQDEYTESEPDYTEDESENTTIINLKKKVNKLIKENGNLKDKIKKLRKNKPLVLDDFINDFLTDKNREIIIMSLIGLMIIVIFHLLVRSSK
jgi:hypothetical protein